MKLTLGFSPCPNDTFIFDALVNKNIDTLGLVFECIIEDVERLNQRALNGELDITKLSFATFLKSLGSYWLLRSGGALGKGVGPLFVAKKDTDTSVIDKLKIAIPGKLTTANLLFSLAYPTVSNKTEMLFSDIENAILSGAMDAGVIIHEGRFTYESKGLKKIMDLGEWWETTTHSLIPLGGIVIHKKFDNKLCKTIDELIKASIEYSWAHYPTLSEFVKTHAQEMETDVMRKHIELYVNKYTDNLNEEGEKAINVLFNKAKENGLVMADNVDSIFCV